jgi:predicted transcriptional regulator
MGRYRDGLKIIADILSVARGAGNGAKKTRIMYVANLSHELLEKYLWATVHSGFMRLNGDGYVVTEKGQAFLEKYLAFSSRSSELETELQSTQFEREALERMCQPMRNGKLRAVGRGKCRR